MRPDLPLWLCIAVGRMIGYVNRAFVIGMAGGAGSSKATVTDAVIIAVGPQLVALLQMDNYYKDCARLPFEECLKLSYDHPNAFDLELYPAQIRQLVAGLPVSIPVYSFKEYTCSFQTILVKPAQQVVLEGIVLLLDEANRVQMNLKVFVDTDADVCFIWRLQRDIVERGRTVESVIQQYLEQARPRQLPFVGPSKCYADVIIPHGGAQRRGPGHVDRAGAEPGCFGNNA